MYVLQTMRHKLVINCKNDNEFRICWQCIIINFFDVVLLPLSSLVTGPVFMSISLLVLDLWQFFLGLARNAETGNTPVWILSNIWRLKQTRDTKLGTDISKEMLLCAAKFQDYSFDRFWVRLELELKLIIFILRFLKHSQNFFKQSLSLYAACLCHMLLNDDIVGIEKPDEIFSPTFAGNESSGLFLLCQSFLLNIQNQHK